MTSLWGNQSHQHSQDVQICARFSKVPLLPLAEQLSLASEGGARNPAVRHRRLSIGAWGICLRVVFGPHATWLLNPATHMWGSRRFATHDDSRNNRWVTPSPSAKAGTTNHTYPSSPRHGLAWYEFDPSWIQIKMLKVFHGAQWIREGQDLRRAGRIEPGKQVRFLTNSSVRLTAKLSGVP